MSTPQTRDRAGDTIRLPVHRFRCFFRQRAPFPLQPGVCRNHAELSAALYFSDMQRGTPQKDIGGPGAEFLADAIELDQGRPQWQNGVDSLFRPAAVGRFSENFDLVPGEALVGHADVLFGRFEENSGTGTDRQHRQPFPNQKFRSQAAVFFIAGEREPDIPTRRPPNPAFGQGEHDR